MTLKHTLATLMVTFATIGSVLVATEPTLATTDLVVYASP